MSGLILIGLLFLTAVIVASIYNKLVRFRNEVKNSFSQIDVQLKRRYDLIPNLVETAKAYMKHEKDTLEAVIRARNVAQSLAKSIAQNPTGPDMKQLVAAEGVLSQSLGQFMALAEAYPDLKANSTMNQLMEELSSTENKISFARQAYNDAVMNYNNTREVFPNSLIAGPFNFNSATYFEVENQQEKEAVRVNFN